MRRPIHEVQVEIVLQCRRIQHLIRGPRDLPWASALRLEHAGEQKVLVVPAGEEGPLGVPGDLRLEPEYVPAPRGSDRRRPGRRGGRARGGRRGHPVGGVGPEQRGAEERAVGRRGGRGRSRRGRGGLLGGGGRGGGGEVEEREVGSSAAGDEAVTVDGARAGGGGCRGGGRRRARRGDRGEAGGRRRGEVRCGRR